MPTHEKLIYKYLQGECSAEEIKQLNQWIKTSKDNARLFFQIEELYFQGKRDFKKEEEQTLKAEKKLFEQISKLEIQKSRPRRILLRWSKYAAIFIATLTIGGGIFKTIENTLKNDIETIAIESGNSIRQIVLPDSSKVWLNKNSRLTYASAFVQKERKVQLEGEAYFEVSKNKEIPFIVNNELMQVKVLGTTFNLKCTQGEPTASATLIEGVIEVKGNNHEGRITLSPGQSAEVNTTTKSLTVKQVNAKMKGIWRKGLIPFEGANLRDIASTLEKYYPVRIVLAEDIDLQNTYSGVLKQMNNIESVLKSLKNSIPIEYRIEQNKVYIANRKQ